MGYIELKFETY